MNAMQNKVADIREYERIGTLIQRYVDSAKSGREDSMNSVFHQDATIFGHAGAELFSGPIQQFYSWNKENGAAPELQARVTSIDLVNTVASVRVEIENWTGLRFTDLFTLFKIDGEWKITNKVFHLHG